MSNKKINDGGPAFPHDMSERTPGHPGMSLRHYFAAKAMAAMVGSCRSHDRDGRTNVGLGGRMDFSSFDVEQMDCDEDRFRFQGVAVISYQIADAMIAARGANS